MKEKILRDIENIIREIIDDCEKTINKDNLQTPNKFVIKVILNEFIEIRDFYAAKKKILLLGDKNWKLWSIKTIIDSADYKYDAGLFDKVRTFEKNCKLLDNDLFVYKY
ncbi:MAG: hypothetical protein E7350_01760 [Clostridiales bacterium]|nr:hypothetical protein [Clostridiales bacterium]